MKIIKLRILLNEFWPIVFWLTIFLYGLLSNSRSTTLAISFIIVTLLRILFLKKKYLIDLAIDDGVITIIYLTAFLRQKEFKTPIDQSLQLLYEKKNWAVDENDSLSITGTINTQRFQLVGKEIKAEVKRKIRLD